MNLATHVNFTGKSTINIDGVGSKAIQIMYNNGSINFNGEAVINAITDTIDIFAISNAGNNKYNENVHFNDSLTINSYGESSKAIYLDDGYTYDFNKLNINVYGNNSYALYAGLGSNLTLDDETSLNAFKDNSYALYSKGGMVTNTDTLNILGNILSDDNANISLSFNDKSSFTGSTFITSY